MENDFSNNKESAAAAEETVSKKGGRSRKFKLIVALTIVLVIAAVVCGTLIHIRAHMYDDISPRFTIGKTVYFCNGIKVSSLPSGYKLIGKIKDSGRGNFESIGVVPKGANIYINPSEPDNAFISNIVTYDKNGETLERKVYELYVTNNIRDGVVQWDNKLYRSYINTGYKKSDFTLVGTIKSVEDTMFLSENFTTNIKSAKDAKVSLSSDKKMMYLEAPNGWTLYLKLADLNE